MDTHTLRLSRHIKASPKAVYDAWLSADAISRWMGPMPNEAQVKTFEPEVNGTYRITMVGGENKEYIVGGTFKELDEPHKIVMTWQWEHSMEDINPETLITVTFAEKDGGTQMDFLQENMASEDSVKHHTDGWGPSFDKLENVAAE